VKSQARSDNFRTLVRFNLPTVPNGCTLESATLRLYATSADNGRSVQAWRLAAPWAELQVTWANQPATAGNPAVTASGRGNRDWNVTEQVSTMLALGINNGFLIRDAVENGRGFEQTFAAREQRNRPLLILQFDDA
jgi:large repetitive protein